MQTKYNKKTEVVSDPSVDRYVVIRSGARVSDEEYTTKEDAQPEYETWKRVVNRWPDGTKVEIVNLSKKKQ